MKLTKKDKEIIVDAMPYSLNGAAKRKLFEGQTWISMESHLRLMQEKEND